MITFVAVRDATQMPSGDGANAGGEPQARERGRCGEHADHPEVTQWLACPAVDDQPAARRAQSAGDVLD